MRKSTVLVLDSFRDNMTRISSAVRPFSAGVMWAETFDEAKRLISEARPQIILAADDLPGLSSPVELIELINNYRLAAQLVVLTREPNFERDMDLVASGVFMVLASPINVEKLRRVVKKILDSYDIFNSITTRSPLDIEKELAIYKCLASHQEIEPLVDSIRQAASQLFEGANVEVELEPSISQSCSEDDSMISFEPNKWQQPGAETHKFAWKGESLGSLTISFPNGQSDVSQLDAETLDELVWAASLHLYQAKRYQDALQLASRDHLTGLLNRRAFAENLSREFAKAERHNTPMSLLMLDIDHFKSINDNFGHQAGDEILKWLASVLQKTIRFGDLAFRVGGEEFAVLLPWADEEQAKILAERLKVALAEDMNLKLAHLVRPTISQGVATMKHFLIKTPEDLIYWSDQAMYLAKKEGRNTIRLLTDLQSKTKFEDTHYVFQ
ncbi:MAG: GGDEF domain-containing protein [Deltaproteobacteria bacterium]|jgi:diguanylate cyclase (GGDEF)-like protein|nr:GGDEF domain-containing protein [Deltaproteobacteria bacterium]